MRLRKLINQIECFFVDGTKISEINKVDKDIVQSLPCKCKVDAVTIQFVGLTTLKGGRNYFFLPKGSDVNDYKRAYKSAKLSMKSIGIYSMSKDRSGQGAAIDTSTSSVSVVTDLIQDFYDNGIMGQTCKISSINGANPNWGDTFANETIFTNSDGVISFLDVRSDFFLTYPSGELSDIHTWVMETISSTHGWWVDFDFSLSNLSCKRYYSFKHALDRLRSIEGNFKSERHKRTISLLKDYLCPQAGVGIGSFSFGISDFHTIWEHMLTQVTPDVTLEWVKKNGLSR